MKKSRQKQKEQCLELPKYFQSLILCAAYLWSVVGGVLQNGVCVFLYYLWVYVCVTVYAHATQCICDCVCSVEAFVCCRAALPVAVVTTVWPSALSW